MAITPVSFSTANPTGSINTSTTSTLIAAPAGLAVGHYYVIAVFFGQAVGTNTLTVPAGFTNLSPTQTGSNRLIAVYGRLMTSSADVTAVASIDLRCNATSTRVTAIGIALTGFSSVASSGALEFSASAAATFTLSAPASGDARLYFVGGNTSSTSTHPTFTGNTGTKIAQVTALNNTPDPSADTVLAAFLDATTVTSSVSEANHVSFGIGLTAAVTAKTGTASGALSFTGSAAGAAPIVTRGGPAAGAVGFAGSVAGKRTPKSSTAGTVAFSGFAIGGTLRGGPASGAFGFAGSAVGKTTSLIRVVSTSSAASAGSISVTSAGGGQAITAPAGLAVGHYYVIAALFGAVTGAVAATTPAGFTALYPVESNQNRLLVLFGRPMLTAADVAAVQTVTLFAASTSTRAAVLGVALTYVDFTATPTVGALTATLATSSSIALAAPSAGGVAVYAVGTNNGATSTHPAHTPDSGSKVGQVTSYSGADPSSDTVLSVVLDAANVAFSVATANAVSFGVGLTAKVDRAGTAAGTLTFGGTATGLSHGGGAVGTVAWAGTATGKKVLSGTTAGTITWGGAQSYAVGKSHRHTVAELMARPTFYLAHRGSGDDWPEHTMLAYSKSVGYGMKAIEVSTSRTSDGIFVCHHDLNLSRMTGINALISSMTWAQIRDTVTNTGALCVNNPTQPRQPLPLLTDVLDAFAGRVVMFIEAKSGSDTAALLTLLDTYAATVDTGKDRLVWKQSQASNSNLTLATSKGYHRWGYWSAGDDQTNLATRAALFDYLGTNYLETDPNISNIVAQGVATGKPTIMWEIHSNTVRDHAASLGVRGMMTSSITTVSNVVAPPEGAATGTVAWAGTATGYRPVVGGKTGSAAGTISLAGTAAGKRPASASTAGAVAWAGATTGRRLPVGTTAGTTAWAGTAVGLRPAVALRSGSAAGFLAFLGAAVGSRPARATTVGSVTWSGTATGGQAIAEHDYQLTATLIPRRWRGALDPMTSLETYPVGTREHQALTVLDGDAPLNDYQVAVVPYSAVPTDTDWRPNDAFAGVHGVWIDGLPVDTYRAWARAGSGAPGERAVVFCGLIEVVG